MKSTTTVPYDQTPAKPKVKLQPVGLFATPDSLEAMHDYIAQFSGAERVACMTCAYMMWNLAAKLTEDNFS